MKKYIGQPQIINKINKNLIKDIILRKGPISKPQIASITKLSLPTVNKIVDAMLNEGLLKASTSESSVVGRKPVLYELKGDTGYVIALYIENEYSNGYVKGALVDLLGNIVFKEDRKIDYSLERDNSGGLFGFIDYLMDKVREKSLIKAVSIGIPGVADEEGCIYRIPNIQSWEGINLKQVVEQAYNIPCYVENDVNLTAVGIFHKYFQGKNENIVYVYFGEGIGAGIILKGKLYKGKYNYAGEISHIIIKEPSGKLAEYRERGVFGSEYLTLMEKVMKDRNISSLISNSPENDEIFLNEDVKKLILNISCMLINMIPLINPEVVALRGAFLSNRMLKEIECSIRDYIYGKNCPQLFLLEDGDSGLEGTFKLGISQSVSNYAFVNDKGV